MGAGASRKLKIVEPQAVTPFSNHQGNPLHKAPQPRIPQEQLLSHDNEDERNKESSFQGNIEWDVSHTGTLRRYKTNYPEQAEDFQTMFENMQVLRNTMTNNPKGRDLYSKLVGEAIDSLSTTSYSTYTSAGTNVATDYHRIVDFAVEIEGAELLQRFAQDCFNDYYEMGAEQDDDNSLSEDESWEFTCFDCLQQVLATIQNFADFHDGFCSASAQAGVVPMCLENIVRLDRENDNWQSGDEESEPIQLIDTCLGILHNISRRLRDRELFVDSEKTLLHFAKVKNSGVAATALLCLAYLVNEDTNHLISADENLLCFIITMLMYQSIPKPPIPPPGQPPGIWLSLTSVQWGIWPKMTPARWGIWLSWQNVCQRSETKGFRNSLIQHVSRVQGSLILILSIPRGFVCCYILYSLRWICLCSRCGTRIR